ncbi:MAG: hypothetical protein IPI91_06780 [Flavobacteriales bacterium]|nr:hypothetical protein [Flavobacteriales bacterium]
MKIPKEVFFVLAAIAVISSCKKDEHYGSGPTPTAPVENPLKQVFAQNLVNAMQQFTVNATTGGSIQGQDGVYMYFGPNAFRTQSGSLVAGSVDLELVEALTVGDMLWLNKQTLGNDNGQLRPLVSGGQFFISAEQGGQPLKLAPGASYVNVPTPSFADPNMAVFSGEVDEDGEIIWDPWNTNPILNAAGEDTSGYNFPNDSLGWINCDYFSPIAPSTDVQVTCPFGNDHENTFVWLVFTDQNSMTGVHGGADNVFSIGPVYDVPLGMNITVVALSKINGEYASSFTTTVVTQDLNVPISLQPTTLAQFGIDAGLCDQH